MKTKELTRIGYWSSVLDAARFTVGKEPLYKIPSHEFKLNMLIAEHSPIRLLNFSWIWKDIPHWVGVHWVRHKWECFVRTQRTDRTGIDRTKLPQDEPQDFMGLANPQSLIDTMRKRLCYKASPETRKYAEDLKMSFYLGQEPEMFEVLVPNCVYRGGCPEPEPCGWYENFSKQCNESDIRSRYSKYSEYFLEVNKNA